MIRFERVLEILDRVVGGATAPVGFHGPCWRGTSRDDFDAKPIFGLPLFQVGNSATSNLVKALKGKTPFGAKQGNDEADFNRMQSGMPPVSTEDIAFIQTWIDEGCSKDDVPAGVAAALLWRKTNAPTASLRTDDTWFSDPPMATIGQVPETNRSHMMVNPEKTAIRWVLRPMAANANQSVVSGALRDYDAATFENRPDDPRSC
jgi:hypothetical protein